MNTRKLNSCIALGAAALFAACSTTGDTTLSPTGPSFHEATVSPQTAQICKTGPAGTYSFTASAGGNANTNDVLVPAFNIVVPTAGALVCTTVFTRTVSDNVIGADGGASDEPASILVTEQPHSGTTLNDITAGPGAEDAEIDLENSRVTVYVNAYHGATATFHNAAVNHPPPPICDFITFGRLVIEENGYKVVISGNAGGNQPGGGILAEFHVDVNGTDNHVANVDSYGPIGGGALSSYTNSRVTTGTAKNGADVELRLWDGGEPGKGTDRVYLKINDVEIFGAAGALIDQGNMQYHSNCRGPKS